VKDRVQLQNQVEALLEEMRIKLSSVVSDLFGLSGRRILRALSEGEQDPAKLAQLGSDRLKCSQQELTDALQGAPSPIHLAVLKLFLQRLEMIDTQIEALERLVAKELTQHEDAVARVAEIPGFGVDSAQQIIAEIGVDVAAFPSAKEFSSWIGVCPGSNVSAEQNSSSRSPKGNRYVRKVLTQAAQAAVRKKGSHFQSLFRRYLPRLSYAGAIWTIAHRLACLVWKILHDRVHYIEQGAETNPTAKKRRAQKLAQALRRLGYTVTLTPTSPDESLAVTG